ncbi:MAG: class I SAM-dependent methyltransferase [Candidatus Lokiarchaeota archaeon]|nr:class I SAM-dependent methyltransferase [Candidatus Lokiarchaeota archaeon]
MQHKDPTGRFSDRANFYAANRPKYPPVLLDKIQEFLHLGPRTRIADLGSGTGIFTRLLLGTGARVYGIEPNEQMRVQAESALASVPNFTSVAGRAEATTMPDGSIDLVTVAQALHWFKFNEARAEIGRILVPGGCIAVVWNKRLREGSLFNKAYERFLQETCPEYNPSEFMEYAEDRFNDFLNQSALRSFSVPNDQELDWNGLQGRFLSASYAPRADKRDIAQVLARLRKIFDEHQVKGVVTMLTTTRMFYGRFESALQ